MNFSKKIIPVLLLFAALFYGYTVKKPGGNVDWRIAGGSKQSNHYSALKQINTHNVKQLQQVWEYHSNDADLQGSSQIQCNPIIVNGVLYGTTPHLRLVALDAATGEQKWMFNPELYLAGRMSYGVNNNRGVTYWEAGNDKRILYCAGSNLYEVNALTGEPEKDFGNGGWIDLHDNLELKNKNWYVGATSPGIMYKDIYILGSRVNESAEAAPGSVRAFDVRTGKLRWIFHTIPHPGEAGYNTWPDKDAWMHLGAANSWGGMSLDEQRGMLFMPTGSISPDFWGGKRKGKDLFANCVIALDAATGKMKWYYQVVHHDLWDRDPPTTPVLVTVTRNGHKIDAVSQATKFGYLYVLNRVTGKPIFPIHETPVPTENALPGEEVWPTQPIPTLPQPYARQTFSENDINPYISAESKAELLGRIKTYRYGQLFFVPGKQTAVAVPGFEGGAEWGGSGFDPQTGILYINANEIPYISTMTEARRRPAGEENFAAAGARLFARNCISCHGQDRKGSGSYPSLIDIEKKYTSAQILDLLENGRRMMPPFKQLSTQDREAIVAYITSDQTAGAQKYIADKTPDDPYLEIPYQQAGFKKFETLEGLPAISPPWGTLNAINLSTGKIMWKVPLGEEKSLMDKGLPITGTQNFGGPVVTAGGLIFIAATKDEKIRAFDKRTGKELWEAKLPFAGYATPSTYQVNGRQYLVVACGGGKLNSKSGDAYVAFALPK